MRVLVKFLRFWYDFVIGDDASVAAGVVLALAGTAILARTQVAAWWLLPVAVVVLLGVSLARAVRATRSRATRSRATRSRSPRG
jgi:hypothetical protein